MPYLHEMINQKARLHPKAREDVLHMAFNICFGVDQWTHKDIAERVRWDFCQGVRWEYYADHKLICTIEATDIRGNTGFVNSFVYDIYNGGEIEITGVKTIKEGSNRW